MFLRFLSAFLAVAFFAALATAAPIVALLEAGPADNVELYRRHGGSGKGKDPEIHEESTSGAKEMDDKVPPASQFTQIQEATGQHTSTDYKMDPQYAARVTSTPYNPGSGSDCGEEIHGLMRNYGLHTKTTYKLQIKPSNPAPPSSSRSSSQRPTHRKEVQGHNFPPGPTITTNQGYQDGTNAFEKEYRRHNPSLYAYLRGDGTVSGFPSHPSPSGEPPQAATLTLTPAFYHNAVKFERQRRRYANNQSGGIGCLAWVKKKNRSQVPSGYHAIEPETLENLSKGSD